MVRNILGFSVREIAVFRVDVIFSDGTSSNTFISKTLMAFRFEDLKVWQNALSNSNEIDMMVKSFPKEELYSLSSQMKRAADSVV